MATEGKGDELKGKAKEAAGNVTGDEELQARGQSEQSKSKIKQAGQKVKQAAGKVKDAFKR
jgi:uncharacterized protein YjbJ (UPF0337 family)